MSHRIVADWMGTTVETLADLMPASPRAVIVGVNPAPSSVAAGHYYQKVHDLSAEAVGDYQITKHVMIAW